MKRRKTLSEGKKNIRRIGGALYSDYRYLCEELKTINRDYFPLFDLMGFNSPEDTDRAIGILLGENVFIGAKKEYIAKEMENVESGRLKLEKLLSTRIINKEYPTPEERERVLKKEIHRAITYRYKEIEDYFRKEYGYSQSVFHKHPLKICGKAISLTSDGFIIDEGKFIEIYGDYLEANESKTGKQHQEAADAINRFFNGQIEITDKEIERYFIIECGLVKPNPKSINREDYMRLGYRGKVKVIRT